METNNKPDFGLQHVWDEYSTMIPESAYGGAEEIAEQVAGKEVMFKNDFMDGAEHINTNLKATIQERDAKIAELEKYIHEANKKILDQFSENQALKIELSNYAYQIDLAKRERDKAESESVYLKKDLLDALDLIWHYQYG